MRKIIVFIFLILAIAVIGGCSGNSSNGDGVGEIIGTIDDQSNLGETLPIYVMVIEEDPTADSTDFNSLTMISETITDSNGNYSLSEIPAGQYYVVAYKDLNGNAELNVASEGPIDAAGFYGLSNGNDNPEMVTVTGGETTTDIDFPLDSNAKTNFFEIQGRVFDIMTEDKLEGVEVELYGTAGIKITESVISADDGYYTFPADSIIDGEYYLKASLNGSDYLSSVTPLVIQISEETGNTPPMNTSVYWSVTDDTVNDNLLIGVWDYPDIGLISESFATDFGYTQGSGLIGGSIGISGSQVILNPDSGNIGYIDGQTEEIDYTAVTSQGEGFAVKDVGAGNYTITANYDMNDFYEHELKIEEDTFTFTDIITTIPR